MWESKGKIKGVKYHLFLLYHFVGRYFTLTCEKTYWIGLCLNQLFEAADCIWKVFLKSWKLQCSIAFYIFVTFKLYNKCFKEYRWIILFSLNSLDFILMFCLLTSINTYLIVSLIARRLSINFDRNCKWHKCSVLTYTIYDMLVNDRPF